MKVFSASWFGVRRFFPSFPASPAGHKMVLGRRWSGATSPLSPTLHPALGLASSPSPHLAPHFLPTEHCQIASQRRSRGDLDLGEREQGGGCILSNFSLASGTAGAGLGLKLGGSWGKAGESVGGLCVALSLHISSLQVAPSFISAWHLPICPKDHKLEVVLTERKEGFRDT